MNKGVIYVLTNPAFPEYVKIGYADNLEKRLASLNRSACLPFAFRAYCVYEVKDRLSDMKVHEMIDKINPELRSIETFDGKPRVREFYNMTAEDAYDILQCIASLSGTTDCLKRVQPEGHEIIDERIAEENQNSERIPYTEADHLAHGSTTTRQLYETIRNRILAFGDITVEPRKLYIAFKRKTNICDIEIQRSKLRISINMQKGKLNDPDKITKDVSNVGRWGNGDYRVDLTDGDLLESVMMLIRQAYDFQD